MRRLRRWLVRHHQLQHHPTPRGDGPVARRPHDHAWRRLAAAGGGKRPLASRSRPCRRGSCRRARSRVSAGGRGAAAPRPMRRATSKIVSPGSETASRPSSVKVSRAAARSCSSLLREMRSTESKGLGAPVRGRRSMRRPLRRRVPSAAPHPSAPPASGGAPFSVPARQGRALAAALVPEEAHQVARRRGHVVRSERTTNAWLPTKQPCSARVPKSSGRSARAAGRMPPDAPPGR